MFSAWRQPRLWLTLLWSFTLSTGLVGLDWGQREQARQADRQTMVLVPENELGADVRRQTAMDLSARPGVRSARWSPPAELTRRFERRYPQTELRELIPEDDGWLPWVLEVRFTDPLDAVGRAQALLAQFAEKGGWLGFWDGERLEGLRRDRSALRALVGFSLGLAALIGAAGLLAVGWPATGGRGLWVWSAVLGPAVPGAAAAASWLAGAAIDGRSLALALVSGFTLAAVVASMLRQRYSPQSTPPPADEAVDERAR